jgi:hypothetical protein
MNKKIIINYTQKIKIKILSSTYHRFTMITSTIINNLLKQFKYHYEKLYINTKKVYTCC